MTSLMKTLYLHIGQPRTGTTAIQRFCSRNDESLVEKGLSYLRYGRDARPANHKFLWLSCLLQLGGRLSAKDTDLEMPDLDAALAQVAEEIKTSPLDKFLVSFEGFSAVVLYDSPQRLLQDIQRILSPVCDIKVICYCRDPLDVLISNYNQRCKSSPFIGPFLDFAMASIKSINQKVLIDLYADVFGQENMVLKRHGDHLGSQAIADFFSIFGVDINGLDGAAVVNESTYVLDMEPSRISNNLRGVPDSHKDRFIYGYPKPKPEDWEHFIFQLEHANSENAKLFEDAFGVKSTPITLTELIWREREYNHRAPTEAMASRIAQGLQPKPPA